MGRHCLGSPKASRPRVSPAWVLPTLLPSDLVSPGLYSLLTPQSIDSVVNTYYCFEHNFSASETPPLTAQHLEGEKQKQLPLVL